MMSPSVGIWQRLTTVFTSRWFIAIMMPRPGITWTPSIPAIAAIWPAQAPDALIVTAASTSTSAPVRAFRTRAMNPVAVAVDGHDLVVRQDPRATVLSSPGQRPDQFPHADAGVRNPEG